MSFIDWKFDKLKNENDALRKAVDIARLAFEEYRRQHLAKGTSESTIKADTNQRLATIMTKALNFEGTPPDAV